MLPFHWTSELATKLLPFTVSTNDPPPAVTEVGAKELTEGTGFGVGGGGVLLPPAQAAMARLAMPTRHIVAIFVIRNAI